MRGFLLANSGTSDDVPSLLGVISALQLLTPASEKPHARISPRELAKNSMFMNESNTCPIHII